MAIKWAIKDLLPIYRNRGSSRQPCRSQPPIRDEYIKMQDPPLGSWMPVTLGAPVLTGVIIISLSAIALLEYLSRRSNRDGGVVFAKADHNFTPLQSFTFLYFPTILAVLYSMLWSWIDLDAKRLEPYFQLSKQSGASAEQSLLLHYPVEFFAFVPLRAARLGHWAVFCAGTTMMVISWAITPLQSGIFATSTHITESLVPIQTRSPLVSLTDGMPTLDAAFLSDAYSVIWLDEELPGFVTWEYALEPFNLGGQYQTAFINWTVPSTSFFTELTCTPAQIDIMENSTSLLFSDGKNCTYTGLDSSDFDAAYLLHYIGYQDGAKTDYALSSSCPQTSAHEYLAVWAELKPTAIIGNDRGSYYNNFTAAFCEARYYSQPVNATVSSSNFSVVETVPTGPKVDLTDQFDWTRYEYELNVGVTGRNDSQHEAEKDFPDRIVLDMSTWLKGWSIESWYNNMIAFAIGSSGMTIEQFSDPRLMYRAFSRAHKLLFALALNRLVGSPQTQPNGKAARVIEEVNSIFVVRVFAILVECFLLIVAGGCLGVLVLNWRRRSNLAEDPASIRHVVRLLSRSANTLKEFMDLDDTDDKSLETRMSGKHYQLQRVVDDRSTLPQVVLSRAHKCLPYANPADEQCRRRKQPQLVAKAVLPYELSWYSGFPFIVILSSSIALLIALYERTRRLNGLPVPSANIVVQQIILSYIPTAFATVLEPCWVLLNRLLCILKPFEVLHRDEAPAHTSISLKYTSLPPQLIVWRALKAKHFLLASVCSIALLANPLAIALSALFKTDNILLAQDSVYFPVLDPFFNGTWISPGGGEDGYEDHFYIQRANLSKRAPLPPWVTPDYYFLPVNSSTMLPGPSIFEFLTRGFGIDSLCRGSDDPDSSTEISYNASADGSLLTFSSRHTLEGVGNNFTCVSNQGLLLQTGISTTLSGPLALEIYLPMDILNANESTLSERSFCQSQFLLGWLHADCNNPSNNKTAIQVTESESLSMVCRPILKTAEFLVRTSFDGRVISYTQATPFDADIDRYFAPGVNAGLLHSSINLAISNSNVGGDGGTWHPESMTSDWMNYFLVEISNSRALVDPTASLPSFSAVAPMVQDIHRSLFAILLHFSTTIFIPATNPDLIRGSIYNLQPRVFMNGTMFIMAITILILNLVVAVFYYVRRPARFLPRMPTSIASVLAFMAASHALDEVADGKGDERYRFGKFIGVDGRPHVGIETAVLTMPLSGDTVTSTRRGGMQGPPVPPKD